MIAKEYILKEIETLQPKYYDEVLYLIKNIKAKQRCLVSNISETALLSEEALAKDWLSDTEDEAWANL